MDVTSLLAERRSTRGFLPTPVPHPVLEQVFGAAQRAPSWCNIQPWRVWVTEGEATSRVTAALVRAAETEMPAPDFAWPPDYPAPYGDHRRACGRALYEAMGIARDDRVRRQEAWMRNFRGFGAPHLAFVALDKRLGVYGVLDVGIWLEAVLLVAQSLGLHTCAQAALAAYPGALRRELGIPEELGVLVGIALGHEDPAEPANACRTTRSPLGENVSFVGV